MVHRLCCLAAYGIFSNQGLTGIPCIGMQTFTHWTLDHQESPENIFKIKKKNLSIILLNYFILQMRKQGLNRHTGPIYSEVDKALILGFNHSTPKLYSITMLLKAFAVMSHVENINIPLHANTISPSITNITH